VLNEVSKTDLSSKEALAWAAGFFVGEGSVSIGQDLKRGTFSGMVSVYQAHPEPLTIFREIVAAHGVDIKPVIYQEQKGIYLLWTSTSNGSALLNLLMPYLWHPRCLERTRIYLKMFPPGERYVRRNKERKEIFLEWQATRGF